jgi:hypothetical protein
MTLSQGRHKRHFRQTKALQPAHPFLLEQGRATWKATISILIKVTRKASQFG